MESALLLRGDCKTCSQRRVLGLELVISGDDPLQPEFRCCACVDEYGKGPVSDLRPVSKGLRDRCLSEEPPAKLSDVPADTVHFTHYILKSRWSGVSEPITAVTDPTHTYFSGHGGQRVWPASVALADFLIDWPLKNCHKVVELGAGTGLPSLILARRGCSVLVTDVPWVLPLMEWNVQANFQDDDPKRPRAMGLRWGSAPDVAGVLAASGGTPPDLLIAADVVYKHQDFEPFLNTLKMLKCTSVLLSLVERGHVVRDFLIVLARAGWRAKASKQGDTLGGIAIADHPPAIILHLELVVARTRRPRAPRKTAAAVQEPVEKWEDLAWKTDSSSVQAYGQSMKKRPKKTRERASGRQGRRKFNAITASPNDLSWAIGGTC